MVRSRNSVSAICRNGRRLAGVATVLGGVAALLGGCSSTMSELPTQLGGLPANTPPRPDTPPVYPAVHDMPPPRSAAVLTDEERKKVESDLAAMRAEQAKRASAKLPD